MTVPEIKLDATDAAELAEMLQFLSQWLDRDPGRLAASLDSSSATPPTAARICAPTWSACLPVWRQRRRTSVRPPAAMTRQVPRSAGNTLAWQASTSFVLALRATGAPR
jgi:hypothetical protein